MRCGNQVRFHEHQRQDSTVSPLFECFRNDRVYFVSDYGDILIIHCEICDCAPRPIPPKVRKSISILLNCTKGKVIKFINSRRAQIQRAGIFWRRVPPKIFEETLTNWLVQATSQFRAL